MVTYESQDEGLGVEWTTYSTGVARVGSAWGDWSFILRYHYYGPSSKYSLDRSCWSKCMIPWFRDKC